MILSRLAGWLAGWPAGSVFARVHVYSRPNDGQAETQQKIRGAGDKTGAEKHSRTRIPKLGGWRPPRHEGVSSGLEILSPFVELHRAHGENLRIQNTVSTQPSEHNNSTTLK